MIRRPNKNFMTLIVIALTISALYILFNPSTKSERTLLSTFIEQVNKGEVKSQPTAAR